MYWNTRWTLLEQPTKKGEDELTTIVGRKETNERAFCRCCPSRPKFCETERQTRASSPACLSGKKK